MSLGCVTSRSSSSVDYRSGTVNSKSFVGKAFLRIKWKYGLTGHFKHEMIGKHFTETSYKVELQINRLRINRVRPASVFHEEKNISIPQTIKQIITKSRRYRL